MTRLDRLGLSLLAGGIGLGVVNVVTWALGRGMGAWRPPLSGALMAAGLVLLAVGVSRGIRQQREED
ncbi:hypothetical protein [Rubrivirga marina]|uniref:Uncharacterized protein n=1 Tax=Rubrivirga marina TaxID=1196024 RepID=A0A271J006_9BACT|nr:hypothetical protein [Rubrivirga marina]PAP76793.1 hypothetical protein BSZ37_10275 [Rubrivirga marina]